MKNDNETEIIFLQGTEYKEKVIVKTKTVAAKEILIIFSQWFVL